MKIVVVGCGKIGTAIIGSLVAEGHDVTAVDINAEVISGITDQYDVMTVQGNGVDCDTLTEAGVADARLFISVTPADEVNILSCFLARRMGAHHTVARIEDPNCSDRELVFIKQQTNVSMFLKPAQLMAGELLNRLQLPSGVHADYFARRAFEMIEVRLRDDSKLNGINLTDMRKRYKGRYLVCAVARGEDVVIPDGTFELRGGDRMMLTAEPKEIDKLLKNLGYKAAASQSVMILGGSHTAYQLGNLLIELGAKVKIIEQDRNRCRELCEALPKAVIINGDGTQGELLREEGLLSTDAFVTLTGMDEENLLMAIFASKNQVPRTVCKIDRSDFTYLAEQLGVEEYVSPKRMISDVVIRYARAIENSVGSNVETLYRLLDGRVEAAEFNVRPGFKYDKVTLTELRPKMKPNILIGGILRDTEVIIPGGNDWIQVGDRVVVLAAGQQLYDLSDIVSEG